MFDFIWSWLAHACAVVNSSETSDVHVGVFSSVVHLTIQGTYSVILVSRNKLFGKTKCSILKLQSSNDQNKLDCTFKKLIKVGIDRVTVVTKFPVNLVNQVWINHYHYSNCCSKHGHRQT